MQDFSQFVLGLPISTGGIQRVIDRMFNAVEPFYTAIGDQARQQEINGIDETAWYKSGKLHWLYAMVNSVVAFKQ